MYQRLRSKNRVSGSTGVAQDDTKNEHVRTEATAPGSPGSPGSLKNPMTPTPVLFDTPPGWQCIVDLLRIVSESQERVERHKLHAAGAVGKRESPTALVVPTPVPKRARTRSGRRVCDNS